LVARLAFHLVWRLSRLNTDGSLYFYAKINSEFPSLTVELTKNSFIPTQTKKQPKNKTNHSNYKIIATRNAELQRASVGLVFVLGQWQLGERLLEICVITMSIFYYLNS
jgi:hypothetical protein